MIMKLPTAEWPTTVLWMGPFTELGEFRPQRARRHLPLALRMRYAGSGRHHARPKRQPAAWLASRLRDLGDLLFAPFMAPEEARA